MVRFVPPGNAWMIKYGDRGFYERNFYLADSSVFNVFDVPLLVGDPRTALAGIDKVVLSESIARKYFGDENPMGKILDAEGSFHFEVTGVMRDLPANTHLGFDILAAFRIQEHYADKPADVWDWRKSYSYVLLREGSDPDELEARLPAFVEKYVGDQYDGELSSLTFRLQPVTDIHLHSHLERELTPNSDIRYVYLFGAIAVFIILIACINFMNPGHRAVRGKGRGNRPEKDLRRGQGPGDPAVHMRVHAHDRACGWHCPPTSHAEPAVVQPAHGQIPVPECGYSLVRPGCRRGDRCRGGFCRGQLSGPLPVRNRTGPGA